MVVDSSALVAVLLGEPESDRLFAVMATSPVTPLISAVNYLETSLVARSRLGQDGIESLESTMRQLEIQVVDFDLAMARRAELTHREFGRGHHKAALNMGDCAAYALATHRKMPLLFKGNDFSQTPIPAVTY